jgi:hypothetical protein
VQKLQQFALGSFLRPLLFVLAFFFAPSLAAAFSAASLSLSTISFAAPFVHGYCARFLINYAH